MSGFVKLYRQIQDSPLWGLPPGQFKVAMACLLQANWRPQEVWIAGGRATIPVGSFVASQERLAEYAGVTRKTVRLALGRLQDLNFLNVKRGQAGAIISINNFADYQQSPGQEGPEKGQERARVLPIPPSLEEDKNIYRGDSGKPKRKAPAVPLPDDWEPSQAHRDLAAELGVDCDAEAAKMRDWALAKDERKVRWGAAFSGWLRRAGERKSERRASAPSAPRYERLA